MDSSFQISEYLEKRINFFVKFVSVTLTLFGVAIILVQVVKLFLEGEGNYGLLFGIIIGSIFIFFGRYQTMKKSITKIIFGDKKKLKLGIFLLPLILNMIVTAIIFIVGVESWKKMDTEGGIIEYATGLAYLFGFIFALPIGKLFLDKRQKLLGFYYYLLAGFCLFICLEELSWGQRFIGVQSPEFFENYNSKSELSLHNLVWLESYLYFGFIILGALGGISWFIVKLIDQNKKNFRFLSSYLVPSWFISSFFLIVFAYFFTLQYMSQWEITLTPIKECMELTLGLGFLSFILISFFRQPFDFNV